MNLILHTMLKSLKISEDDPRKESNSLLIMKL